MTGRYLVKFSEQKRKMTSSSSYDLLKPYDNYKTETCLVITPYVEATFFEELIKSAKPRNLIVIIDDGCRRDDLELINDAAKSTGTRSRPKTVVTILGSAPGLVHLKLVYSEMKSPTGRSKRRIVFGSANATRQGFSGEANAEILCNTPLIWTRHKKIIDWCDNVISKAIAANDTGKHDNIEEVFGQLAPGIELRLPAFTLGRKRQHLSSFDLWIQRGRILAKFRPEPTFLKISVPLKKGLGNSLLSNVAAEVGFASPEPKTLNFHYIGSSDDEDHDEDETDSSGPWRSQYFTWSNLGEWCSEECFQAMGKEFVSRGKKLRNQRLSELEKLRTEKGKSGARDKFLASLGNLWDRFGEDASSYLKGDTRLDRPHYAKTFEERVKRDLGMLDDEGFRDRYLRGYEITELPRFRNDVRGWNSFMEGIAKEICFQNRKQQPRSKILKAVREVMENHDDFPLEDSSALLRVLREKWECFDPRRGSGDPRLGSIVKYHEL